MGECLESVKEDRNGTNLYRTGRRRLRSRDMERGGGQLYWIGINRFLLHAMTGRRPTRTHMFDQPVVALSLTNARDGFSSPWLAADPVQSG